MVSRRPTYVEVSLAGELVDEELRGIGEEELITGGSENHLGHRQTVPAQGAGSVSIRLLPPAPPHGMNLEAQSPATYL